MLKNVTKYGLTFAVAAIAAVIGRTIFIVGINEVVGLVAGPLVALAAFVAIVSGNKWLEYVAGFGGLIFGTIGMSWYLSNVNSPAASEGGLGLELFMQTICGPLLFAAGGAIILIRISKSIEHRWSTLVH